MSRPQYLGRDIPIFTIQPNWGERVTLRTIYDTLIYESIDTAEQRIIRRPRCLYGIRFNTLGLDGQETGYLRSIVELAQAMPLGMPVWTEATKLTRAAGIGDTELSVDLMNDTLWPVLSDYALVWTSFNNWELLKVDSIGLNTITLSDPVTIAVDERTFVLPMLFGKLPRNAQKQLTDEHGIFSVDFEERFNGLTAQSTVETDVPEMIIEYPESGCREEFTLKFPMNQATMCLLQISDSPSGPWDDHIFCSMIPEEFVETGGIKSVRINNDYNGEVWFRATYADRLIASPLKPEASEIPAPFIEVTGILDSDRPIGTFAYSKDEDPYISATDLYVRPRARKEYRQSTWGYTHVDGDPFDYSTAALSQIVTINPEGSYVSSVAINFGGVSYTEGMILLVDGGTYTTRAKLRIDTVVSGAITAITLIEPGVYSAEPTNPVSATPEILTMDGDLATFNLSFTDFEVPEGLTNKWTRDRNDPTIDTVIRAMNGYENNAAVDLPDFGYVIKARSFSETCRSPLTVLLIDKRMNDLPVLFAAGHSGDASNACDFPNTFTGYESGLACSQYVFPANPTQGFLVFEREHVRGFALARMSESSGLNVGHWKYLFWVDLQITDVHTDYLGFPNHFALANFFYADRAHYDRISSWDSFPHGYVYTVIFANGSTLEAQFGDGYNFGSTYPFLGKDGSSTQVSPKQTTTISATILPFVVELVDITGDAAWQVDPLIMKGFEVCASAFDDQLPPDWTVAKPYFNLGGTSLPNFDVTPVVSTPIVDIPTPLTPDLANYAGDDFESYADQDATGTSLSGGNHFSGNWVVESFVAASGGDDFEFYALAVIDAETVLDKGEAFGGDWVISSPSAVLSDDFETYTVGEIGRYDLLDDGSGFGAAWVFAIAADGYDDFESYPLGVITTTLEDGRGWVAGGWVIS